MLHIIRLQMLPHIQRKMLRKSKKELEENVINLAGTTEQNVEHANAHADPDSLDCRYLGKVD
eukprot:1473981-Karenia_brevis.AAC.1